MCFYFFLWISGHWSLSIKMKLPQKLETLHFFVSEPSSARDQIIISHTVYTSFTVANETLLTEPQFFLRIKKRKKAS